MNCHTASSPVLELTLLSTTTTAKPDYKLFVLKINDKFKKKSYHNDLLEIIRIEKIKQQLGTF